MRKIRQCTVYATLLVGQLCYAVDPLDIWTWRNPLPSGNDSYGVCYGDGTYVAVGQAGTILTSHDGTNWVDRTPGATDSLVSVARGGGLFVAVGLSGTIITSPDGVI